MPHATLHDLTFDELRAQAPKLAHARTLWRALYRDLERDVWQRADFLPPLRSWLERWPEKEAPLTVAPGDCIHSADGLTRRFLSTLRDGQTVETVLMGYPGRFTACLSTQAGCAMGCVFCATGQRGFARHLSVGEIVAQAVFCQRLLAHQDSRLRNLVIMGMGEPLHNYDNTMKAMEILTDTRGLNLGPSRITISTVGVVPAIRRWTEERRPYRLAVSLHAANQAGRSALVPAARRWPLDELIAACRDYSERLQRRVFFEWTLIRGSNDSPDHAREVAALLAGLDAHVNLIPLNPTAGFAGEATDSPAVRQFQDILREAGLPSTVRQRRGIDVEAGCGQLRAAREDSAGRKNGFVPAA